ncbi:uncharacterized protein LOC133790185 isoform X1 [Humulus lupulus]|uniref:uncharacterized protein LOC133790185 isoform X1 n=1 Tax=Humulus lupulus TaxID=3486 RepID=UPI002B406520|nr:uncharacterized protein LOC133790185 isoform X1 [Humulus lupulus]
MGWRWWCDGVPWVFSPRLCVVLSSPKPTTLLQSMVHRRSSSRAKPPLATVIGPKLKRLKLRKNNWSSESYRFDEVFTDTASQRRVYEAVAKPIVEVTHQETNDFYNN